MSYRTLLSTGLSVLVPLVAACRPEAEIGGDADLFVEVTAEAGLDYSGPSYGASWGDFDGDGSPDLWVSHHQSKPALYLNLGGGRFRDVVGEVGSVRAGDTHGVVWGDFDGDGDQDLFATVGGLRNQMPPGRSGHFSNRFYVNTGGRLEERAEALGVAYPEGRGRQGTWVDWNEDGILDLVVTNDRPQRGTAVKLFEGTSEGFREAGEMLGRPLGKISLFATLSDLVGDGRPELVVHGFSFPQAVFEVGGGLRKVTGEVGFPRLTHAYDAAFGDFDGDLRTDVVVARRRPPVSEVRVDSPTGISAQLYPRAGTEVGISFEAPGAVALSLGPSWKLGVTPERVFVGASGWHPEELDLTLLPDDDRFRGLAPYRPGLDAGVYVGLDLDLGKWRIMLSKNDDLVLDTATAVIEAGGEVSAVEGVNFRAQPPVPSSLLLRRQDRFVDSTDGSGLEGLSECDSVVTADFDNDMDLDLYFVCSRRLENLPNRLFLGDGQGRFAEVPSAGGARGSERGRGDSVAVADFDEDGFLDLFVGNGAGTAPLNVGPDQLFRNRGNENHWLQVDLEGTVSNRDGIGSVVTVTTPDDSRQERVVGGEIHRFSQNHRRLHFGLGSHRRVQELRIEWPSGHVQIEHDLAADQRHLVIEERR